ncbi:MAG: TetR/AcrR family transcriptional regulator [Lachnospiraceae bacterium]|nr:TetR/AcrR family transcriptional regulator [Lachnospiraceae bacterium]MBR3761686.1 TetR/AcrR family transcriptional regulator [Lachnospiraceae bacterium]
MGEKSQQKKKYIIEKARQVFIDKGYRSVTMKDIIEACNISRGGLYLYFPSTQEIFLEVLKQEMEMADDVFSTQVGEDSTAADILELFFAAQKAELLNTKDNLAMATYEYYYAHKPDGKDNFLREQFEAAVEALTQLIEMGVEDGELYSEEPQIAAEQIMYTIEGLKIGLLTMKVTEEEIDKQLHYLLQGLGLE